ncbi:MAG: hypothetical protein WCD53_29755 [Microcoleus sp.]
MPEETDLDFKDDAVYWAFIQQPGLKNDIPSSLITEKEVLYRTQKVLFTREGCKLTDRHSEVVIYDCAFVRYLMMQMILPLVISRYDGDPLDIEDSFDDTDFLVNIIDLFTESYWDMIRNFISARETAQDFGLILDWNASTVLRSYKIYLLSKYQEPPL